MTRRIFTFFAVAAVLILGATTVHVLFAHGGGGMMGMKRDCPMTRGGMGPKT